MPRRRSLTSQVEDTRRRAPKVGARAPHTLKGGDALRNDERPVCGPAVRTSRGGGDTDSVSATDNRLRGTLVPLGQVNISPKTAVTAIRGGL
jgi:hypothetical protein